MASMYMKINNQADISIHAIISTAELFIRFIWIKKTIIITGIQIATHELAQNLHLITACLNNHLIVNQRFDMDKLILFITASQAE
jgi:hypothetical protein